VTYRDPDGRDVVFAPWVFGVVPDPVDRPSDVNRSEDTSRTEVTMDIGWYHEDRTPLRGLFEEAEDSSSLLDTYIDQGRVLVARLADEVVGHLQLVDARKDRAVELKNMAVVAEQRGLGIGRRLVDHAVAVSRQDGYAHMIVATAAADIENLRFYQRRGFRLRSVEWDAFNGESGYPSGLTIDGIPLRDRVWFTQTL
jgi:GNAT superfamily N-acetyltransferase